MARLGDDLLNIVRGSRWIKERPSTSGKQPADDFVATSSSTAESELWAAPNWVTDEMKGYENGCDVVKYKMIIRRLSTFCFN